MKKIYILLILLSVITQSKSQILLDTPYSGAQTYDIAAPEYVRMLPGFEYTPLTPNYFRAYIDPNATSVSPITYGQPVDPETRILNYNFPVGTTPGQASVSLTGGATYTIPIFSPPGTAGMQPSVSLVYNSQSGNGIAGYGWNIAGLSSITRVGHTIYHDGAVKGVDFVDDHFALDGQRLIKVEGIYGADGTTYYTEVFNGSKIISHGATGMGPEWFEVIGKDGSIVEYGKVDNARESSQRKDLTAMSWLINKITDANGNYLLFLYNKKSLEINLKEIQYTGNDSIDPPQMPYNSIKFYYGERIDTSNAYISGSHIEQTLLLDHIDVQAANTIVKTYKLKYYYNSYSKLNEVEEYGEDGSRFNSTVFGYEDGTMQHSERRKSLTGSVDRVNLYADFNNDGKTDIFRFTPPSSPTNYGYWAVHPDMDKINSTGILDSGHTADSVHGIICGDYNGDGYADVQIFEYDDYHDANSNKIYRYQLRSLYSNGNELIQDTIDLGNTYYKTQILSGDFDGDNKDEILLLQQTGIQTLRACIYKITTANLANNTFSKSIIFDKSILAPLTSIDSVKYQILDFNGDGIDELLADDQSYTLGWENLDIYKFQLKPANNYTVLYSKGEQYSKRKTFQGDFNGDGNSDILNYQNNNWFIKMSTGLDLETHEITANILNINPYDTLVQITIQDFNQDGKTDIAYSVFNPATFNLDIHILTSNGTDFTDNNWGYQIIDTLMLHFLGSDFEFKPIRTFPVDFNGDGNGDYVFEAFDNSSYFHQDILYISSINPGINPLIVHKTCNGFNLLSSFKYKPLSNESIYTKSTTTIIDCMNIQPPQFVVSSFNTENGIGGVFSKHYNYSGATINLTGKGFLGFKGITVIDSLLKIVTNSTFEPDPIYFIFKPTQTITKTLGDTILNKSLITNSYKDITNAPAKVIFPYISKTYSFDYFTKTKKTTIIDYDIYANLISKIDTIYPSFESSAQAEFVSSITYSDFVNGLAWCPAKPSNITQTKKLAGEDVIKTKKNITYWPTGNVMTLTDFYEQDSAVQTTYSDYVAGLAQSTRIRVVNRTNNTNDIVQQVTYDDKFRFPLILTDAIGLVTTSTFNAGFGNKLTQTDANELTTTYQFDGFGRPLKVTNASGIWVKTESHFIQNSAMEKVLFYTQTTSNNHTSACNYYDKLGRTLYTTYEYPDSSKAIIKTEYNAKGLVAKVSEPCFVNSTPTQFTITEYDDYNRPKTVTLPTQAKIEYTYPTPKLPGRTTTVKNSITEITISKTTNATGLLVSSTDPGGSILYVYYSDGQLKSTTTPDGSITSIKYDVYGRQSLLDDPDADSSNYKYNALGQLQSQTDDRGVTFEILYDNAGRLIKKTGSSTTGNHTTFTNTYNPPTAPKGSRGLPAVEEYIDEDGNTVRYSYTYDDKVRLTQKDIACSGRVFTYNYAYDALGNMHEYTYPSGYSINFVNKANNGVLEKVIQKSDSKVIFEPGDYNARGQMLHYKLANGSIFTSLEFDEYGMPTFIKTGKNIAAASEIQNLETNFNIFTGNLAYRKDYNYVINGIALQEAFTYDDNFKNSLKTWQVDNLTQYSMTVEETTGNILTKSDITSTGNPYLYSKINAGPHAVTGITAPLQLPADALQEVSYNLFRKVKQISNNLGSSLSIKYGPDEQRIMSESFVPDGNSSVLVQTKFFVGGDFEVEILPNGNERYLHYLPGGGLYISHNTAVSDSLDYILTDYQGTWYKVINESGTTVEHYSFDPWGRRRNASDWTYTNVPAVFKFSRGYTGHEMLDAFGLINMNGRVYDPIVARFLSPDNYVQDPQFSHSYNRYSYCFNNPLKYTDPSGMQSKFHGVYNPTQPANRRGGQNRPQVDIDGLRFTDTFGRFGGAGGFEVASVEYAGDLSGYGINPGDKYNTQNGTIYNGFSGFNYCGPLDANVFINGAIVTNIHGTWQIVNGKIYTISENGSNSYHPSEQGGGWLETANNYSGIATTLITGGTEITNAIVRGQFKSATSWTGWTNLRNSQQAWRTASVLGKTGATTLKIIGATGGVLGGLSASYSTYKVVNQAYNGGLQSVNGWDAADATVGWAGTASAAALILGTSNPIGWAVIGIGATGYGAFRAVQYIYENY